MWKYECKRHLLYMTTGVIIGALVFGALGWQREGLLATLEMVTSDKAILQDPMTPYLMGALAIGGLVNGLMLMFQLMQRFNINYFIFMMIFFLASELIILAGMVLLLPAFVVCIYGWLTVPNRGKKRMLDKNTVTSVQEVERVYRLHHHYDETCEIYGKNAWNIMLRVNILYFSGILALFLVLMYVEDLFIVMAAGLLYMMLFFQLTKYKNKALQPIISLLYDKCDPQACASAIFALAKKAHKKKNFPLTQQLAQCMIYLNDPHLAIDVLVTSNPSRNGFVYPYHTLMAYAYYQLGDESMVKHHLQECEKSKKGNMAGPMNMFAQQALASIQNKLDLMKQDFRKARTYYMQGLQAQAMPFQLVDSHYYLGLISFVEQDMREAQIHFQYVQQHGNRMYFKEKADSFMETILALEKANEEAYSEQETL